MKKAIVLFMAVFFCLAGTEVFAQKQMGDEMNLELQFAPLGGTPMGISGLRFRKFLSETSAFRVNLFLGGTTESNPTADAGDITLIVAGDDVLNGSRLNTIDRTFDFSIRPGYEIHFDGTDRLSPYVGVEVEFATGSTTTEDERFSYTGSIENDQVNVNGTADWVHTTKQSHTRLGFNLVAGFDFYFVDNLYLGGELGFGWGRTTMGDVEYSWDNDNAYFMRVSGGSSITATQGDDTEYYLPGGGGNNLLGLGDDPEMGGSMSAFGPTVNGRIRLGYLFN